MRHFLTTYRDSILALTGIIIAIISLGFAIWQGREEIRHNHISVEPRINAYFSNDGRKNQWGIYAINNGMGTAFVNRVVVMVNGKPVEPVDNNIFFGAVLALGLNAKCFVIGGPRPNDTFKVGEEIFLVEARGSDKNCAEDRLRVKWASQDPHQLDFVLDTESIYGDKFRYTYSQNRQVKLD
ncbi:TPA: hypothetical protein L8S82_004745 [Klebsiella aerogenes]|nr:hypothetical protein [Klebsiella aerogenes]HBR1445180.1 hypothetical protein [Klebsiella quasipneumoniae subsp. quasipneumoniae]HDE1464883.1 hypothetical protein [Klebsiella quasipneumoniae]HDS8472912.1 hypothetical protein [Klebsiella quasipneumoniae subsp. similipneumoniae]